MKWKLGYIGDYRGYGFRELWVPFWGVPIIKTVILWGLYWGLPFIPEAIFAMAAMVLTAVLCLQLPPGASGAGHSRDQQQAQQITHYWVGD